MNYREEIIKELETIKEEKFMAFLYNLIRSFKKEWGF